MKTSGPVEVGGGGGGARSLLIGVKVEGNGTWQVLILKARSSRNHVGGPVKQAHNLKSENGWRGLTLVRTLGIT